MFRNLTSRRTRTAWPAAGVLLALSLVQAQAAAESGLHGRVYSLNAQGQVEGIVAGAKIEIKGATATATTDANGRYRLPLAPGQYFFKVTAPGYKDEDVGRGFQHTLTQGYAVLDFSLTKGPNDPNRKPPELPPPSPQGRLIGCVFERLPKGELIEIPQATIRLRLGEALSLVQVQTHGLNSEGKPDGHYETALAAGSWTASVTAAGFETLVDPKPIPIVAGETTERDFVLTRQRTPEPQDQGIKGRILLADQRSTLPPNISVTIDRLDAADADALLTPDNRLEFVRRLRVGTYEVRATANGYRPARSGPVSVLAGAYSQVVLRLVREKPEPTPTPRGAELQVLVFTSTAKGRVPLAAAEVLAVPDNQPIAAARRAASDAVGRAGFKLDVAGRYSIVARKTGYKPDGQKVDIAAGRTAQIELTLEPQVAVTPTPPPTPEPRPVPQPTPTPTPIPVPLPQPMPLPSGPVQVEGFVVYAAANSTTGHLGVPGSLLTWTRLGDAAQRTAVRSDTRGGYQLALPAGLYQVDVQPPTGFRGASRQVQVALGMKRVSFILERLAPPTPPPTPTPALGTLLVQVLERVPLPSTTRLTLPEMRPIAGAQVRIRRGGVDVAAGTTDASGRLERQLPQGSYQVTATAAGFNIGSAMATLGTTPANVQIVLERQPMVTPKPPLPTPFPTPLPQPPANAALVVRTFDAGGKIPLANASVKVLLGTSVVQAGISDGSGTCRLAVKPGAYTVIATRNEFATATTITQVGPNGGNATLMMTRTSRPGSEITPQPGPSTIGPVPQTKPTLPPAIKKGPSNLKKTLPKSLSATTPF